QPDELVQAALPTTRVSGRNAAKPAPQNPVDASATATHSQPSKSCSARQRVQGARLEIRTPQNHQTQSLIPCLFTQDSGLILKAERANLVQQGLIGDTQLFRGAGFVPFRFAQR